MGTSTLNRFSLKCQQCGTTGTPVRVESQTEAIIVLSVECPACAHVWTVEGDLPAFMTWLKPDRRRTAREPGSTNKSEA